MRATSADGKPAKPNNSKSAEAKAEAKSERQARRPSRRPRKHPRSRKRPRRKRRPRGACSERSRRGGPTGSRGARERRHGAHASAVRRKRSRTEQLGRTEWIGRACARRALEPSRSQTRSGGRDRQGGGGRDGGRDRQGGGDRGPARERSDYTPSVRGTGGHHRGRAPNGHPRRPAGGLRVPAHERISAGLERHLRFAVADPPVRAPARRRDHRSGSPSEGQREVLRARSRRDASPAWTRTRRACGRRSTS